MWCGILQRLSSDNSYPSNDKGLFLLCLLCHKLATNVFPVLDCFEYRFHYSSCNLRKRYVRAMIYQVGFLPRGAPTPQQCK